MGPWGAGDALPHDLGDGEAEVCLDAEGHEVFSRQQAPAGNQMHFIDESG